MATGVFQPHAEDGRGDLVPAVALLAAGLAALLVASLSVSENNGQYLVVLPPWSSAGQTFDLIAAADGALVAPGRFPNIAIAASRGAGFASLARDAGAWIVVPSPRLAGCIATRAGLSRR